MGSLIKCQPIWSSRNWPAIANIYTYTQIYTNSGLPTKDETVKIFGFCTQVNINLIEFTKGLSTEISLFWSTRNPNCKKTYYTDSVESSLKSHTLWITLYICLYERRVL